MQSDIRNIVFNNKICTAGFSKLVTAKEHMHGMVQIFLFVDNPKVVLVNGKEVKGDCICIPPNIRHSFVGDSSFCFTILMDPVSKLAKYIMNKGTIIQIKDRELLQQSIRTVFYNQTTESFQKFIIELYKQIGYEESNEPLYDERVEQTIAIVRDKAIENITIPELGYMVGLSDSRLSHIFRKETGFTIKNYILMMKWKASYLQMLSSKNITIAAMDGGFASPSHFSSINTKMTGITAKQMTCHSIVIKE